MSKHLHVSISQLEFTVDTLIEERLHNPTLCRQTADMEAIWIKYVNPWYLYTPHPDTFTSLDCLHTILWNLGTGRRICIRKTIALPSNVALFYLTESPAPAFCILHRYGELVKRKAAICTCMCWADESMFEFGSPGKSSSKYSRAGWDLPGPVHCFDWCCNYGAMKNCVNNKTRLLGNTFIRLFVKSKMGRLSSVC